MDVIINLYSFYHCGAGTGFIKPGYVLLNGMTHFLKPTIATLWVSPHQSLRNLLPILIHTPAEAGAVPALHGFEVALFITLWLEETWHHFSCLHLALCLHIYDYRQIQMDMNLWINVDLIITHINNCT